MSTTDAGKPLPELSKAIELVNKECLDVIQEISPKDRMYLQAMKNNNPKGYWFHGRDALRCIRLALVTAGKDTVETILDLPCGYGRVLRMLKAAFPEAALTACDLDKGAVDFCAGVFGATPVYSAKNPVEIQLDRSFDLIWCGSLFTHLPEELWDRFLAFFGSHLKPRGILVFTGANGRRQIALTRSGKKKWYRDKNNADVSWIIEEYADKGFVFVKEANQSISSPAWVCARLARLNHLSLLSYTERAWGNNQDVVVCSNDAGDA